MSPITTTDHDVVVIGAGQAGLAIGYHLARQGRDFVILDGAARIGDTWRSRWDSLRLFTPAQYDGPPGMPFPADADTYPRQGPGRRFTSRPTRRHSACRCGSTPA